MSSEPPSGALPFAITAQHFTAQAASRWRTPLAVLVLGGTLIAALSGILGGGAARHVEVRRPAVGGELVYDPIVRSGNWYETTVSVRPAADVKDLTVAVDDPLWQDMSIDTLAPDAESAESVDGRFRYHFGEVEAGKPFRLKLNGQIQPGMLRRQSGRIHVLDGDRTLLEFPVTLTVLP